jgi:hypothetical protein
VSIFVQKTNHRGDAINVIDLVCDAIKDAVGLDDRWYSLSSVDWEIVKANPRIFISIGQDSDEDCQVCSHCGDIKALSAFNRNVHARMGVTRICKDCRVAGRKLAKSYVLAKIEELAQ